MAEYVERELIYGDFEKCNDNNPQWTPGRVKTLISRQPAADVAPVVHGRWKQAIYTEAPLYICSECYKPEYKQHKYCPNCGARMDGDWNGNL